MSGFRFLRLMVLPKSAVHGRFGGARFLVLRNGDAHAIRKQFTNNQVAEIARIEGEEISMIINVYPK